MDFPVWIAWVLVATCTDNVHIQIFEFQMPQALRVDFTAN